jgi:hypothetical protein
MPFVAMTAQMVQFFRKNYALRGEALCPARAAPGSSRAGALLVSGGWWAGTSWSGRGPISNWDLDRVGTARQSV